VLLEEAMARNAAHQALRGVFKAGWLTKKPRHSSGLLAGWRRRWIQLEVGVLAYYTARPVDGGKLKGELILAPGTAVRALERDPGELGRAAFVHPTHGTCFEVVRGDGRERMPFQAPLATLSSLSYYGVLCAVC
jgi:hypothetical protein